MRFKLYLSSICATVLFSGCAPAHLVKIRKPQDSIRAEVLIYRKSALDIGPGMVIVADNNMELVELPVNGYTRIGLPAGVHNLSVRTEGGDQPYMFTTSLKAGDLLCLRSYLNPANFAKALVPISYAFGNTFLLEQTVCPTEEELGKMWHQRIQYQSESN